jgi:hypothetical protein
MPRVIRSVRTIVSSVLRDRRCGRSSGADELDVFLGGSSLSGQPVATRTRKPRGGASTSASKLEDFDFEVEDDYDLDDNGWENPDPKNDEHWRSKKDVWGL